MYEELQNIIDNSNRIVFFTGAGVSTESGIPDFRSVDGIYSSKYDVPPEVILSHTYFFNHTEKFFEFYRDKMIYTDAKPNYAHKKAVELEKSGKLLSVVTQNIDGLHYEAGSKSVYELHGSIYRNHCMKCSKEYDLSYILGCNGIPKCSCGGIIKPDVVLYEEGLDENTVQGSVNSIKNADTMIIAGTSLSVYPAAGLVRYFNGKNLVLINISSTPMDGAANLTIHDKVGKVMKNIKI